MSVDPQIAEFLAAAPADAPDFADMPLSDVRAAVAGMQQVTGPGMAVATVRELTIPGPAAPLAARLFHPEPGHALPLLVLLFGGGFVAGAIDVIDSPARQLAVLGRVAVLTPDYRLAPEHPHPAAVDDTEAVLRWVMSHADELGADPNRIAVGGESAGGAIALAAALRCTPGALAGLALIYPVLDTDFDTPSYAAYADGYLLTRSAMRRFWADYLAIDPTLAPDDAVPARTADLSGLPPVVLAFGEYDVLRSESEALAARLLAAGVPTRAMRWLGLTHASWYLDHVSAACVTANQALARSVGALLHATS